MNHKSVIVHKDIIRPIPMIPLDPATFTSILSPPTYLENPPQLPVAPTVIISSTAGKPVENKVIYNIAQWAHDIYSSQCRYNIMTICPSRHMTIIQSCINVNAMSWHCIDIDATLSQCFMTTGIVFWAITLPCAVFTLNCISLTLKNSDACGSATEATVFILSIGTPYLIIILVLKFAKVYFTTCWGV